jgi:hypothetical protein
MTGKISELTQLTGANVADDDDFEIRDTSAGTSGSKRIALLEAKKYLLKPRGALVTKTTNLTTLNFTTAAAILFDNEVYDTDACHDTGSNTSRLSVPSGWSWVRLWTSYQLNNVNADAYVSAEIRKNGSLFAGGAVSVIAIQDVFPGICISTPPVSAIGGTDYFESYLSIEGDTSISIVTGAGFALELLA